MPVFPAGNLQGNLPQTQAIHYDSKFRDGLHAQTPFVACAEPLEMPLKSGNTYKIFQYQPLSADTNQTAEGDPGSSETIDVIDTSATIGEYGDYLNFSSYSVLTAIDNMVENVSRELGYQLGESLSSLVKTVADGANSTDSSVQIQLAASSTTSYTAISLSSIRNAVQSMAGRSIKPFNEARGIFRGVIHPFSLGDVAADNSNDSPIDILKHTNEGREMAEELVSTDLARVVEIPTSGVEFYQSNLVTQTSNYKSVSGLTALSTYIFGKDGVFRVRLAGPNDTSYGDGQWEDIMCQVYQNVAPTQADPLGQVPAWTKYLVHFVAFGSPDPTQRLRVIQAASAVS
jgi:N4-gp56 family major capsid protein